MQPIADQLAELRSYHLPSQISWWPIAPGWWLLLLLILTLISIFISLWFYRSKRFTTIRYIQTELTILKTNLATDNNTINFIRGISNLLRRFALLRFPRNQIAHLTGIAWLKFLDEHGGNGKFQSEFNWLLAELPYQSNIALHSTNIDIQHLHKLADLCIAWIQINQQNATTQ
jgi:hypothetical protein